MTDRNRAGRWRTWDEVLAHVRSRELRETHTVEFKSEDYKSTEAGRKEQAKDIAALAIDGGVLAIGIVEDKPTGVAVDLAPVALEGVVERIEQVCAGRVSPALTINIGDHLRDPDDATKGIVVVTVPATGVPHMVDHRYVGRDNRTTRYLAHEQVARLLARREADADLTRQELDRAYDMMDSEGMGGARLVVVATPVPVLRPEVLREHLTDDTWRAWIDALVEAAATRVQKSRSEEPALAELTMQEWSWYSNGGSASGKRRIPRGVAVRYYSGEYPTYLIELFESGAVRVAMNAAYVAPVSGSAHDYSMFLMRKAVSLVSQAMAITSGVAQEAGFQGTYGVGVKVRGMKGCVAEPRNRDGLIPHSHYQSEPRYREDEYCQIATLAGVELTGRLGHIVDKLLGPLLRAMNYGDPLRHGGASLSDIGHKQ